MKISIRAFARVVAVLALVAVSSSVFGATVSWDGGGGDENWSNALNWSGDALPTSSDDVIITTAGTGTVILSQDATVQSINVVTGAYLRVGNGWVLTVDGPGTSSVDPGATLQLDGGPLAGGTLTGTGDLTVSGIFRLFEKSLLSGSGSLTINNGGELWIGATSNVTSISRDITNNGTITFVVGSVGASFNGNVIDNFGIIDIQNDQSLNGSGVLNNNSGGVVQKSAGIGVASIDFPVNNAVGATIDVQTGTLALSGDTVSGGTITGAGEVDVSGNFTWSGGTITGTGPRVLTSASVPTISCATSTCLLDGATLQLQASATYSASTSFTLVLSNGASLVIDPGKTLNVTSNGGVNGGGGAASSIINNGTIWKKISSGTSALGVPVTMSGTSTVQIDTGTLQFGGGASIDANAILNIAASKTLEVTGGVFLVNSGPLSMPGSGVFKVSAGTLRVPTGVTLTMQNVTLQGSGVIDGGGTLILSGAPTWAGGTMGSSAAPGGISRIDSGVTLNVTIVGARTLSQSRLLQNNGTLSIGTTASIFLSGSATIENNGTIAKSGSTSTIQPRVENNTGAVVNVSSGTLNLSGGGVAAGAYSIGFMDQLSLTGGTFTVAGTATVTGSGTFSLDGATLDAGAGVDLTLPNVSFQSGTITGVGAVRMSGPFFWSGGTIAGSGLRVLNNTSVPTISCFVGTCLLDGAALQLQAFGTFSASSNALVLSNGASLSIDPGRSLDVTNDGDILSGAGAASSIINGGKIWKKTTSGTSTIAVPVTLTGFSSTVEIDTGTLQFGGDVSVAAGTTLDIASGKTLEVTGGVFLFNSGSVTMPGSNGNFVVSAGTLRVPTGVTLNVPKVTLQGSGVIDGGGTLILSGTSFWSGGTMGSSDAPGGITQINSGNNLNITNAGATTLTQNRVVLNDGTVGYGGVAPNNLTMSGNSRITNNGTLNLPTGGGIDLSGSATIENNGTIAKNTSGTTTIQPRVENNSVGTLSVPAGTLALSGGGIDAGAWSISPGATLTLTGGTFNLSGSPTVTGTGALSIAGATLDAGTGVVVTCPVLGLFSGTITGAGAVRVSSNFLWSGGTIAGNGPRVLLNSAAASVDCALGNCLLDGAALQIQNSVTFSSSSNPLVFSNGASLTIDAGQGISITNGGDFNNGGGAASSIINNGTIWKGATAGTSTIGVPVTLSGTSTVNIDSGRLQFGGGADVAAGATLVIAAAGELDVTGGVFLFNSGSVTMPGTGTFSVSAGTLRVPSGITVTVPEVTLEGSGVIDGAGTLILSGTSLWDSGTMGSAAAPGGITQINSGSTLDMINFALSNTLTQGRELRSSGTVNYGGVSPLTMSGGSKITNNAAFHLIADRNINVSGSATIDNNGTLDKSGGSGTSALFPTFNNTGTVSATAGTLVLAGGGTHSGSFTVTAPASLSFSGGVHSMSGGGSIGGTGTLLFSGATAAVGVPVNVSTMNVSAGTATLDANGSAGAFTMTGGTLGGSGVFTLTNGGTWSGGTMNGSGTTINPATKTLAISAPVTLNSRTLQNDGTLTISDNVAGSGSIANNGILNPAGNITINPTVNNGGQIATSGVLTLAGGGTHSGSINVTSPGNVSFSSGTLAVTGGSISGSGTMTLNGATATFNVPVNVGALHVTSGTATLNANASADAFAMSGGTLGGSGTLTLNNGGTWSAGTMSGSGTTANPAAMTFSIPGSVTLSGRTLQNNGTLNVSGGVIAGTGTIDNIGAISDTSGATISAPMNNSGQVTTSALLSLGGNGTHSGTFIASSPASVIDFSGGAQTISGAFAGTGKFRFSGGTEAVNGAWSGTTIDVAGGSVALNTSGTLPALTLSAGTLTGSGNLTVTGAATWSGGTIAGSGALTFDTGATVSMPGTSAATLNRSLLNNGTINFTAASSAMLIDGVPVTNSGTFDIQSSQSILVTAGTPPFSNSGTLKKTSGAGVMQFAAPVLNTGLVQIGAGTLNFSGTYGQTAGTTEVQANATLQTAMLSLNGGSLAGNGTIAGTVDNHAVVAPGASPGTLTINGDYVQASNGVLSIQIGGTAPGTEYDQLLVSGNVTLGGSLNVLPINSFVPATGNAFQVLTFGGRPTYTAFANINGLEYGAGTTLVPTYNANDLQLITNNVQADLAASVNAPPSVTTGSTFAYTVSIINQGGSDATAVTFSAALPPNVTFNSASPAICSGAPNLVCTIGALANQSTALVVLDVTANGAGAAPIVITTIGNEFDPDGANNTASASPSITDAADLRIAVTGTPSTVAGSRAIYTITVTNDGPNVAGNVVVNATASAGLSFDANGGGCAGSFPCTLGALSSGQSATITSAWDISSAAAGFVQLTVNATSSTADPNSSNNSASAATQIGTCPAIVIDAPRELKSGASAEASATATAALSGGAIFNWSISDGIIDSGNGTDTITFTTSVAGTATLAVDVTGTNCTLSTSVLLTVKPRQTCQGTAAPTTPADDTTTADAVVNFSWTEVEGSSGYRLWLQQGDAPAQSLGRTLGTSLTKVIPPGAHHWYVETLFDGCASHQSDHLALTILPAQDCDTHGAPQLTAPAIDAASTSATVAFSWGAVAKAIEYELWLAPAGGVPTLIRITSDTSSTSDVPPGRLEWYVRAIFGGCGATESAHQTFIYTPPPDCTSQRPLLIAPAEGERLTSPVSFEWRSVPGATSYEVYVDGLLAATTTSPRAPGIPVPLDERRWRVRAHLAGGCGALDSAESRFVVLEPSPSCTPLESPIVTAPGQISSGVTARIQWTFVPGANAYVVQISNDPQFSRASTASSTVATRQLPFTFTNDSNVPVARYVRVYAIDTECVVPGSGPFSLVAVVSVLPRTGTTAVALLSDPADVEYTLNITADLAGLSFTAAPTVPWITVSPSSGIVPPGGQTLRAVAHTAGLPAGASTGTVIITTAAVAGARAALGDTQAVSVAITLNNISGATTTPKSTPPPDALTIPAVANVTNFIVSYKSDVRITNTSAQVIKYEINFTPTGDAGIKEGQKTTVAINPGATLALNDVKTTWLSGLTTSGTLEIRPQTETATSTSSAPASGLADRITFATSRTFAVSPDGGTYGQYVPGVPYSNFISRGSIISLQQIAQSDKFRTNLGLVEGSGVPVTVQVRIFDSAGKKLGALTKDLNGGQHLQINEVLKGIVPHPVEDGRIEVEIMKGEGKVTAYASVIGSDINDPLLVPPVNIGDAGHRMWVVPGVAGRTDGSSNWKTDVHIFNAGKDRADLTLAFYSKNSGTATTKTITLAAGEVRRLDPLLSSFFEISQDEGALQVSSAVSARLVVTARTYNETPQGTYGQFIPAATPEEAVVKGSRPLQILQVEESPKYRSNVGFAEVSGKAVTLEVSVFQANQSVPVLLDVTLAPNEFRQFDSLPSTLGLGDTFNARISVRVKDGEGRAIAYLSLVDRKSGDPTFVPGQ